MIVSLSVDRKTMNLLVVFIISTSHFVSTLRSFRYGKMNRSRLTFVTLSHWDYDLEPFVTHPHAKFAEGIMPLFT